MKKTAEITTLPNSPTVKYIVSKNLIAQIEELNKDCVNILRPLYLVYFSINKPSNSVAVGPVYHFK